MGEVPQNEERKMTEKLAKIYDELLEMTKKTRGGVENEIFYQNVINIVWQETKRLNKKTYFKYIKRLNDSLKKELLDDFGEAVKNGSIIDPENAKNIIVILEDILKNKNSFSQDRISFTKVEFAILVVLLLSIGMFLPPFAQRIKDIIQPQEEPQPRIQFIIHNLPPP
jgi:hypothetical protein